MEHADPDIAGTDRWEYRILPHRPQGRDSTSFVDELNELGAQGWEVCGMLGNQAGSTRVLLKRRVVG